VIISRTPLRVSLAGGGTDIKDYYSTGHGSVLSTAIRNYMCVTVNRRFEDDIRVSYSKTEIVDNLSKLEHGIIRECLKKVGTARGKFDEETLELIHQRLFEILEDGGAIVNGIYYCPHMPDAGCDCRKPKPGMLLRAKRERGFDLTKSYVVGDRMLDIEMAHSVGAVGVLVPEPGDQYHVDSEIEGSKEMPDMRKKTFVEAVDWILRDIARKMR
jgi:D-glycero-D-manno-heptose 1,7-bisphosphate phosphatase